MGLESLNHVFVPIGGGGEVIVLDNGAMIDAEAEAMLQALHSRSTGGLRSHLEVLMKRGAADFMKNFYVGYGHKSIGDCATGNIFIEGVSMLAAKAVQDSPLYSGQEASTRYVDFSRQPFIDPTNSEEGRALLEMQRDFYMAAQEPTRRVLTETFPQGEEEKKKYEKAINARAFDITRSLLPAGAATNLAWHTNLRQAADKILFLRHHPLKEVRRVAGGLELALSIKYPNSFGHKRYPETENYQDVIARHYFYHDVSSPSTPVVDFSKVDRVELERFRALFDERPAKTELPKILADAGELSARFQLDFGSFRDLQRHRAIKQRMPLLTQELGFNSWYSANLPPEVFEKLPVHLEGVRHGIEQLGVSREVAQYFTPMGYNVSCRFSGDIPSTVYMVELRGKSDVHPTLQRVAHSIANQLTEVLGIPLHLDSEPGRFDVRRGEQDIVLKDD